VAHFYNHTVFDKEWATLTINEFHEFRTQSTGYWAVLLLLEKVKVVVGATTTPLFNSFEVRILLLTLLMSGVWLRPSCPIHYPPIPP
jgi:hypothetical protein